MPTTLPIEKAGSGPTSDFIYPSFGSIGIITITNDPAFNSISILAAPHKFKAEKSINISKNTKGPSLADISIDNYSRYTNYQTVEIVNGDSFVILVDILQSVLSGSTLGSFGQLDINAQLLVNSVEVPIKSFNFQVPSGKLGSVLNCVLADPTVASVPAGASIKFSLVITTNGTQHYYVLMDSGKLQERADAVKYKGGKNDGPIDEVTFGALDVIADKFSLAPRRPVIMFDPSRIKLNEINTRQQDAIRNELGGVILPVVEPINGLTMKQILIRAYTGSGGYEFISTFSPSYLSSQGWGPILVDVSTNQQGCGFDDIITNIPDYRVRRADFTIEGGWHDGAQPCVAMYGPLYFVEGSKLFIIDVDRALPFGALPHQLTLGDHKALTQRIAFKPDANAVLLTYQYAANDPYEDPGKAVREVFREDTDKSGTTGTDTFTRVVTRRWDYEYFFPDDPLNVLLTLPKSIEVQSFQDFGYYTNDGTNFIYTSYGERAVHSETTTYAYENELLVKSTKSVEGLLTCGVVRDMSLIEIGREETSIIWMDDPYNPGNKLQDRVLTDIYARIAIIDDTVTETVASPTGDQTVSRPVPALLAQASGVITTSSLFNMSQLVLITSIRKTLHKLNDNQFNVNVVESDLLNNTVKRSYADPVTGTNSTSQYGSKSRTILFRDSVSEDAIGPRIPVAINAYELPRTRAIELAQNAMKRIKNPLMQLPIDLPGVDLVIARGSIVSGQKRSGTYTSNYFVTGYTIAGENLGKQGHRIAQSLEAIELLTP